MNDTTPVTNMAKQKLIAAEIHDHVNQYRQQLAQAGTDEQAFIEASVEAKLLTEK